MNLEFLPEAQGEFFEAAEYYEAENRKFTDEGSNSESA